MDNKGLTVTVKIGDMDTFQDFITKVCEAIDDPRVPQDVRDKVRTAAEDTAPRPFGLKT